jgi:hypothetical protein
MITPCILVRPEAKSTHVGSMLVKATNHHRTIPLAMVTLLVAAFEFNPAARAQDVPTASGAPEAGSSGRE